ncbi:MAG: alpha/beta hydrolase [Bacteroidota bacterium]
MASNPIYFAHANGIPGICYEPFLRQFEGHPYTYINCLGHAAHRVNPRDNWKPLIEEVQEDITSRFSEPVVGIGHSLGGYVLLEVAERNPSLFSQLIVMEPPLFAKKMRSMMNVLRTLGLSDYFIPVVKKSRNRTEQFPSREYARKYFRQRTFFDQFHPESFELYLEKGLTETTEGVTLTFSKQIEYEVFKYFPVAFLQRKHQLHSHFYYAKGSNLADVFDFQQLSKLLPYTTFTPFSKGTHMFPLEYPAELGAELKPIFSS